MSEGRTSQRYRSFPETDTRSFEQRVFLEPASVSPARRSFQLWKRKNRQVSNCRQAPGGVFRPFANTACKACAEGSSLPQRRGPYGGSAATTSRSPAPSASSVLRQHRDDGEYVDRPELLFRNAHKRTLLSPRRTNQIYSAIISGKIAKNKP